MSLIAWHSLFTAVGGREALAKLLEVNQSTIWRWTKGTVKPNSAMRRAVNDLCKKHRVAIVFGKAPNAAA